MEGTEDKQLGHFAKVCIDIFILYLIKSDDAALLIN